MNILFDWKKIIFFIIYISFFSYLFKYKKESNISRLKSLKSGTFYIQICMKGKLINQNNILNNTSPPKISAIIPIYNCEKIIKACIRSIQNQNMQELEIILVNDNSRDNSSNIIKELSLEDGRIKIINNKQNMGTLFSRNLGVLNSRGKYISNIDNDDLFLDKDVFDKVTEEAEKGNFDILGFAAVDSKSYKPIISQMKDDYFTSHQNGLILHQPELAHYPFTKNNKFGPNDYHIWAKLIKADLYKKAINNLGNSAIGEDRKNIILSWCEDSSMSIVLYNYAESYKYINKYGIFHYISKKTASFTRLIDEKLFGEIYFLDLMYDFTCNNTFCKKYVIEKAKEMKYDSYYNLNNNYNVKYFKAVVSKILNSSFIREKDKTTINELYKDLLQKE